MPAKTKSAAALSKEAADAASAAAAGGHDDSFADAEEDTDPGISKDLLAYMKMQDKIRKEDAALQERLRQEERVHAERLRKEDLERMEQDRRAQQKVHELQIKLLTEQLAKASDTGSGKSSAKVPVFDLEKDSDNFELWKSRWLLFIKGQKFDLIKDKKERDTRITMELTSALSDHTLAWLISKGFEEKQMDDPEFLVRALEEKIAKGSNPLIHQVELLQISQFAHETTDSLVQRIQEKARKCDFKAVTNVTNHQCLVTLLQAVPSEVRQKLFLAKVKTFEEAIEIVQNEERAKSDAKSCSASSSRHEVAEGNAMSGYKKNQREEQKGWLPKMANPSTPLAEVTCFRCYLKGHWASDCPHIDKPCQACGKIGHTGAACRTKHWDMKASKAQANSCRAYLDEEAAAIAQSHALTAEHNAWVDAYSGAFGPGEGSLDSL